jgi:exopolyphosphatase/guanosine-5'-triphosphate,3'-diphosphate pyrophosphatase
MNDAAPNTESPLAVIDIGSNSICLLVQVQTPDGTLRTVEKHKDLARLRDQVGPGGDLSDAGIARIVSTLQGFRAVVQRCGAEVRAVATAALRAASNRDAVIQRVQAECGIAIDVISGGEEARLAFLGVTHGMGALNGDVICTDVGGGSTELVLARDGVIIDTASVPLGALVVTRTWLGADPVRPAAVAAARLGVREAIQRAVVHWVDPDWPSNVRPPCEVSAVATSGTIQRVARIVRAIERRNARDSGPFRDSDVHGVQVTRAQLDAVIVALAESETNARRLQVPGMDPSRADILLGGALLHEALCDGLGLTGFTVSMAGLRTGVAMDLLLKRKHLQWQAIGTTD